MNDVILDGYKMTELGALPEEWEVVRLESKCRVEIGGTPSRDNTTFWAKNNTVGYPWMAISDFKGKWLTETSETITKEGVVNSNVKLVPKGNIVMSFKLTIGKIGVTKIDTYTNEAIAAFYPDDTIHRCFLYYILPEISTKSNYDVAIKGITLNKAKLKSLNVPLPPFPEQHRIATILSTLDETVEHTEALIGKYKNIKAGLMADLLTRGIDEEGRIRSEETHRFKDSALGRVPEEWKVKRVGDALELKGGSTPSTIEDEYWNGMIPWAVPTDVTKLKSKYIMDTSRKITNEGLSNCSATLLPKGSILLTSRATIGFLAINELEMATNQGFINILPTDNISNLFMYYYLSLIKSKFILQASGSTFLELSKSAFKKFTILLPPLPEQRRIAEILTAADQRIEKEEAHRDKLLQLKKGLMQDLLTGKVRVKVPQKKIEV